jgi:hypothetical protein
MAARVIIHSLGGFFGKGPKGYTRSGDRIREDVCDRLSYDDMGHARVAFCGVSSRRGTR